MLNEVKHLLPQLQAYNLTTGRSEKILPSGQNDRSKNVVKISGTILDEADLGKANLTGSRLRNTDLRRTNLKRANLHQTELADKRKKPEQQH